MSLEQENQSLVREEMAERGLKFEDVLRLVNDDTFKYLTQKERAAILHRVEGMTLAQIAGNEQYTPARASALLHRGYSKIQLALGIDRKQYAGYRLSSLKSP